MTSESSHPYNTVNFHFFSIICYISWSYSSDMIRSARFIWRFRSPSQSKFRMPFSFHTFHFISYFLCLVDLLCLKDFSMVYSFRLTLPLTFLDYLLLLFVDWTSILREIYKIYFRLLHSRRTPSSKRSRPMRQEIVLVSFRLKSVCHWINIEYFI